MGVLDLMRCWRDVKYSRVKRAMPRQNRWSLTLHCGHITTRVKPFGARPPKRIICDECEVEGGERVPQHAHG